jgi:hypothetical protein
MSQFRRVAGDRQLLRCPAFSIDGSKNVGHASDEIGQPTGF